LQIHSRSALSALFAAFCAIVAAQPASAQGNATVRLVGTIPPHAAVQFGADNPAVVTINLNNPQGEIPLFNLIDFTNGGESYTISVVSTNRSEKGQPQLVAADGSAEPVPFQLVYDGQPLQFQNGSAMLKSIGSQNMGNNSGRLGLVPLGKSVANGNYTATLSFVISGN
jgi:hypothetical protein